MTPFTISLRAYNRPAYLRESLESWAQADGIGDCLMIFNLEPDQPDVHRIARHFDACRTEVFVNETRLGGPPNGFRAFVRGFDTGAGEVITAEDDVVVSEDVLAWFEYAQRYRDDPNVFCICAFQDRNDGCGKVHLDPRFTQPSPWMCWRDRWEAEVRDTWDHDYTYKGFDWNLQERIIQGRLVIKPCLSRSQHIGKYGGTHCLPENFESLLAPNFTREPHPGGFRE